MNKHKALAEYLKIEEFRIALAEANRMIDIFIKVWLKPVLSYDYNPSAKADGNSLNHFLTKLFTLSIFQNVDAVVSKESFRIRLVVV